ncbi:DUF2818 family protein [Neisseria leonii]|uniref:DUF2818 family protein n=1 Tax=Neisseria leonii TaxID=2995413 RepID=A0A9X4E6B1_9NEIS|nr:DUF2818 family protein [Neisseria sp. 51.81]MDD9328157.1 DUF2818 family protein [Neisseria sp. 51.81]
MTAPMYILIVLALIFANLPFVVPRWFGVVPLAEKRFVHHLAELAAGYALMAALAYLLENRAGSVYPKIWEFFVITVCLYLVAAFPGFVWRYFWQVKHKQ